MFDKEINKLIWFPKAKTNAYTVPEGVEIIGQSSFAHYSGLTSIVLPDSLLKIEADAFWLSFGLTSIVIPDNVTEIESKALFASGLESVTLGNQVSIIGDSSFA